MELNTEQKIAAEYMDGPALVLAGPGTGKTTTLVARYKHLLINNVPAQKILSCTFSKKAADELKFRLGEATDIQTKSPPIGTFHSLCLKILKSIGEPIGVGKDFVIWAKDWEREKVVDGYLKELIKAGVYDEVDKDEINARSALNFIDDSRETLLDPEDASVKASEKGDVAGIAHAELYSLYNNYLNTENKIDFPRMVELACKALEQNNDDGGKFGEKFTHILVDEYQDINLAQKTLIDLILAEGTQLWAVGDDFQAIYGWRGSDIRYILEFSKQYSGAKVFTLPQNYRSGKLIIDAANRVSANIKEKFDKDLKATRGVEGEIIYDHLANEDNEAEAIADEIEERIRMGVPKSEIAVLARTNKLPINTVNLLIRRGIPLNLKGGVAAFTEYEARLLLTAIASSSEQKLENIWALRMSPALYGFSKKLIGEKWERRVKALATYIQKRPPQGISDEEIKAQEENLDRYRDYILTFKDASSLFGILKSVLDNNENTDRVFVGTIHSAKGLEWDTVIIMGWEDGILPQRQSISHRAFEEERRIAYVGITRAKNVLMLTYVKERNGQENVISPFIDEIFIDNTSQDIIASDQTPLNDGNLNNSHDQFSGIYTSKNSDDDKLENFLQYLRKIREDVKNREEVKRRSIKKIADGQGDGSGWSDQSAGTGFLAEVGYTVKKDGPLSDERQSILTKVLQGQVDLPDWISESVQDQWGKPNTEERFFKIRNTINVALGQQKGRLEPSAQAIEKWEDDLTFLDEQLLPQVERDK